MDTGFKIGSIIAVGSIFLCCGGFGFFTLNQLGDAVKKVKSGSQVAGDQITNDVLTYYDSHLLLSMSTVEFQENHNEKELQAALDKDKEALGNFKSGKSSTRLIATTTKDDAKRILMSYVNDAVCEKGKANVKMTLQKEGKNWLVARFEIIRPDAP